MRHLENSAWGVAAHEYCVRITIPGSVPIVYTCLLNLVHASPRLGVAERNVIFCMAVAGVCVYAQVCIYENSLTNSTTAVWFVAVVSVFGGGPQEMD